MTTSPAAQVTAESLIAAAVPAQKDAIVAALRHTQAAPFLDVPLGQLPTDQQLQAAGLPGLPSLPPLPANPLDVLLTGGGLPALPGVDALLKPITDLLSGFGSGTFDALDPTMIFQQSSKLIDAAMQLGTSGLVALSGDWQGRAADNAQAQGEQAQGSGDEVSRRGKDIGTVVNEAAASVQRGNAKLVAIAESFATTAIAAAPIALTPPGQTMLMASAAEHLAQAVEVVAETRAELAAQTASISVLGAPIAVPTGPQVEQALQIASHVLEGAKPLVSTVSETVQNVVDASTHATGAGEMSADPAGATTTAPSGHTSAAGYGGSGAGGGGGAYFGAGAGGSGGGASSRQLSNPSVTGGQGWSAAGEKLSAAATTATSAAGAGGMAAGMIPPVGAARAGAQDEEHDRSSPAFLSDAVDNTDVVGDMGRVVTPVIGADDPDEIVVLDDQEWR